MTAFLAGLFHAPWMLAGLAVLAIPPLIHLLNRRRFDTVDWGAMQFLQVSDATRRRLLLEEVLLMLLRMGMLAVLVLALAGPFLDVRLPAVLSGRGSRDVVLVIDGSASMGAIGEGETSSPAAKAKEWAGRFLDGLGQGDAVCVVLAREQAAPLSGALSADLSRARRLVAELPAPAGTCDWAAAIRAADALLAPSQKRQREVVLLTDNQKFGVADPASLFRFELLSSELGLALPEPADRPRPKLWMVDLAAGRAGSLPNQALAPLRSNRPVASVGREVRFQGALVLSGQEKYRAPWKIRLEVDGKHVRDLPRPSFADGKAVPRDGRIPFSFAQRFRSPGSHLVSVILEPDPPPSERPAGHVLRDRVPGDNRQDFAVEAVPAIPVLIVDGDPAAKPRLGSRFLRDALSPARDRNPSVRTSIVPAKDFAAGMLPASRAVILHDVARLSEEQAEALTAYIAGGGGVLVLPGSRSDPAWHNARLYRGGEGWLPARLDGLVGDESKRDDARLEPESFTHPVLELFRADPLGGLGSARFPRWWRLGTGKHAPGVPVGQLLAPAGKTPFLVERSFQAGRALVCAVPLDSSFGSNLPDLPAFVPLVHELVCYLAGARSAEFNLLPGQPLRASMEPGTEASQYSLATPGEAPRPLSTRPGEPGTLLVQRLERPEGPVLVFDGARQSGVYALRGPGKQPVYYVVPPDAREADLEPLAEADRKKVAGLTASRSRRPAARRCSIRKRARRSGKTCGCGCYWGWPACCAWKCG